MKRLFYLLRYILIIHISTLLIMTGMRFTMFLVLHNRLQPTSLGKWGLQAESFLRGLWIDNTMACYILAIPLLLVFACGVIKSCKWIVHTINIYYILCYIPVFIIFAANIPYFNYFYKVIDVSIFEWSADNSAALSMIFSETSYFAYILLAFALPVLFGIFTGKLSIHTYKKVSSIPVENCSKWKYAGILITCLLLCACGIKGRIYKRPVKVSDAYYCNDSFLNQLAVNPALNFFSSYLDEVKQKNRQIQLVNDITFKQNIEKYLGASDIDSISLYVKNVQEHDSVSSPKNVVLIFMESMSANYMGHFGQEQNLTPFLDSLYNCSLSFSNCYSTGVQTNNAILGTLYSFPSILHRHSIRSTIIRNFYGFPSILKENGYDNLFFIPHRKSFDDLFRFLKVNGFEEIYSEEDYPEEDVINIWGVPDDVLYKQCIPLLDKKSQEGKPFFTVLLSVSNHPPFVLPDYFKPKTSKIETQIVEYEDWAIKTFFDIAQEKEWFNNTVFVLLGDHGRVIPPVDYELPQSLNHIPLIIYQKGMQPEEKQCMVNQIDVQPILLDLLHINYQKNNLGIDVLHNERKYNYYSSGDILAVRDSTHLYLYQYKNKKEFYYEINGKKAAKTSTNSHFEEMKEYGFSMFQTADYLIRNNLTTVQSH